MYHYEIQDIVTFYLGIVDVRHDRYRSNGSQSGPA